MAQSQTDAAHLIRSRRILLGLSQARLAEMVGCTPTAVRRWERGELAPPEDLVDRLADVLELDAGELRPAAPAKQATVVVSSPPTPPPPTRSPEPPSPAPAPSTPPPPASAPRPAPPSRRPAPRPATTPEVGTTDREEAEPWIHFETTAGGQGAAAVPAAPEPVATLAPASSPPVPVPGPDDTAAVPPPRRPVALARQRRPVATRASYLDSPAERVIYAVRLILVVAALAVLAWLAVWALGELVGAVDEALDFFSETTVADPDLDLGPAPGATG